MSLTSSCSHVGVSSSKVLHPKLLSVAEQLAIGVKVNSCLEKVTPGIFIKFFVAKLLVLKISFDVQRCTKDRFSSLLDT